MRKRRLILKKRMPGGDGAWGEHGVCDGLRQECKTTLSPRAFTKALCVAPHATYCVQNSMQQHYLRSATCQHALAIPRVSSRLHLHTADYTVYPCVWIRYVEVECYENIIGADGIANIRSMKS
jgi:hypothetical protein